MSISPGDSLASGLQNLSSKEQARKKFRDALFEWMGNQHQWKKKYKDYPGQVFYAEALSGLKKASPGVRQGELTSLLDQSALEELHAEIDRVLADLENQQKQCEMYFAMVNKVQEFFDSLAEFEFITRSPTGIVSLASGKLDAFARTRLSSLEAEIATCKRHLTTAKAGGSAKSLKEQVEQDRHVLREQLKFSYTFYDRIRKIDKDTDKHVHDTAGVINEQAIYNFFVEEMETDDGEKLRKTVQKGAQFVTALGGEFSPPGYRWIAGLVNFIEEGAGRGVNETRILLKVSEYRESHSPGEIFEAFTQDPTLMAKGLATTFKKNVDLLLAGIGIFGSEIPGWSYISALVSATLKGWQERRIEEAKKLLNASKPLTKEEAEDKEKRKKAGESLQAALEYGLEKFRKAAEEDLTAALKDKLTEGDAWGKVINALSQVDADKASDIMKDFGKDLGAVLVEPIVTRVMKIIPVTPAQIVSGDDLTNLVQGALTSIGIPGNWGMVAEKTKDSGQRKEHAKSEIFRNIYGWSVAGTNVERDLTKGDAVTDQWVCFRLCGAPVWGYLNREGVFSPKVVDVPEVDWSKRSLTRDGYTVQGGQGKSGGMWHPLEEPDLKGYLLYKGSDDQFEWLRKIQTTLQGRAEDVVRLAEPFQVIPT